MKEEGGERRRRLARIGVFRPDVEAELDAELEFHYQEVVDSLIESGSSMADAEAEATRRCVAIARRRGKLIRIGRRRKLKLLIREIGVVLACSLSWAYRGIWRRPRFSAVIIGTLALGIGANTLVFGVVDRLLLSPPLHIVDADEVRHLYLQRIENEGLSTVSRRFTYPDYVNLHQVSDFRQIAAYRPIQWLPVGIGEDVRKAYVVQATYSLFPLLGVKPLLGRFFTEQEDRDGAHRTVVLSEEYWARRFGRDPSVVGRTISIGTAFAGTAAYEIIGVAPAGFTGAELDRVDLWMPVLPELGQRARNWHNWFMNVVVRLQGGASPEAADSRATAIHRATRAAWVEETGVNWYDPEARVFTSSVIAARGPNPSAVSAVSKWLAALSIIVLIVACANVTNLLLVNNIRMRRELAIRASLGAGPARVACQLLTYSVVLAALGGAAGLVLWFTLSPIVHTAFIPTAGFRESDLVPRVLVFAGVAVVLTSLGAGVLPALQAQRFTDFDSLRTGSRESAAGFSRLRHSLVSTQTTLSVLLLVGAGLFVVSLRRAREFDMGFSAKGVAEVHLEFRAGVGSLRRREVISEALNRIRSLPGVHSAGTYAGSLPLRVGMKDMLRVPGLDSVPEMPGGWPNWFQGSAELPDIYGFRILKGRTTDRADELPGAEPVMLVSARTARALWTDGEALNRCAHVADDYDRTPTGEVEPCRRIVGVFDDVVARSVNELPSFAFFVPVGDAVWEPWGIVLRAESMNASFLERVRDAVSEVSSDIYFADVRPASERVDVMLRHWTLGARLFTAFGLLGLAVSCVGLYSILAFDVAQRRRELGIRSALGARSTRLVSTVLRNSIVYVLGGLALGTGIALVAGRFLEGLLFQTTSSDPAVYAIVVGTLLLSGFSAGLFPALSAASSDPMEVIRTD